MQEVLSFESSLNLNDTGSAVTYDWDLLKWMNQAGRIWDEVVRTDESLFEEVPCGGSREWSRLKMAGVGKRLLAWVRYHHAIRELLAGSLNEEFSIEANPHVRQLLQMSFPTGRPELYEHGTPELVDDLACELNNRVSRVRHIGRGETFRNELRRHQRRSDDSAKSIKSYLKELSARHSKLLVLRVDFGYRHDSTVNPLGPRVGSSVVHDHREKLVDFFKKTFPAQLGYVVKTEFGLYKGPHLHSVFILDGRKVRSDISIAAILGEHWLKVITAGKGTYYNCNRFKGRYLSAGIGMMNYRKQDDWEGAERMIDYITKVDYMVRVWAAGARTLVKGWKPRGEEGYRDSLRTKRSSDAFS